MFRRHGAFQSVYVCVRMRVSECACVWGRGALRPESLPFLLSPSLEFSVHGKVLEVRSDGNGRGIILTTESVVFFAKAEGPCCVICGCDGSLGQTDAAPP